MNPTTPPPHTALSLKAVSSLLLLLSTSMAGAQTIQNPSFETDTFTVFPGYISGNGQITGWTGTPEVSVGLNPAGGNAFASDGVIPDGTKAAFIQGATGVTYLRTNITGLTPGVKYRVSFRATARAGETATPPRLRVSTDGAGEPLSMHISPVGVGQQWRYVGYDFTALAETQQLSLQNYSTIDRTVAVDNFTIAPSSGAWSYAPWDGDETSGVLSDHVYTHAYAFGSTSVNSIVNGVAFTSIKTVNPSDAGKLTTAGMTAAYPDVAHAMTGDSADLGRSFVYGGPAALSFTLSGLKPNTSYVATVYGVAFDAAPLARAATFSSSLAPGDRYTADVDRYGLTKGTRVDYAYTTDATGTVTVSYFQTGDGSFHTTGISNREAAPMVNVVPTFTRQPIGGSATAGTSFTISAGVIGSALTYQWQKNGQDIPGATGNKLVLSNVASGDSGSYRVVVTNDTGTYTSDTAAFNVQQLITGVYDTGVANDGTVLADAATDPHYILLVNPDGNTLIPAVVGQGIPGAWLANSATNKWVGPRANTTSSAGAGATSDGIYVYQTSFDVTGYNPASVLISGGWASDNGGTEIRVNGVALSGTPITNTGFGALTTFTISSARATFNPGVNTLEFYVKNDTVGFTGLRVSGLKVFGTPSGGSNEDPVAVADGFVTTKDTALTISAASLLANDTDPDGNTLALDSVSATSTSGGTVSLSAGSITYTPAAGYTGTDGFSYVVSDGAGGTATGVVQVAVVDGEIPKFEEALFSNLPTSPEFRFLGTPGTVYHLQRSEDLSTWTDVTSTTAPVTGLIQFTDSTPVSGRAFYRISR